MPNIPLNSIMPAMVKLLSTPLVFLDALVANIQLEWLKLAQGIAAGTPLTTVMLFHSFKWVLVLILVSIFSLFIIVESTWSILLKNLTKKRIGAILSDVILLGLVLFLYYFILSSAIYFFFNILLPMHITK